MKKELLLAGMLIATTSVMAVDTEYFIGIGAERATMDVTASAMGISASTEFKDTGYKLKGGAILNNKHRVSLSYADYSKDNGDFDITLLNYDYIIPLKEKFNFLIGGHIGQADYNEPGLSIDGMAYGMQTGILYDITEKFEFELGIGYTRYNADETVNISGINVNVELDNSTSMFIGFNYKF